MKGVAGRMRSVRLNVGMVFSACAMKTSRCLVRHRVRSRTDAEIGMSAGWGPGRTCVR